MWGDVDKYAVSFANFDGLNSERCIAATSLHCVSDSKFGKDYSRTFRYFFYGHIQKDIDSELIRNSLANTLTQNESECVARFSTISTAMLGRLIIVAETTSEIDQHEVRVIEQIKNLCDSRKNYITDFSINADSLVSLDAKRKEMRAEWDAIKEDIQTLGNIDKIQFHFDVFLTRDGLLLLKDATPATYRSRYFQADSPKDYTQNVPIHRVFKTAMNFMKYLLHRNYHHEEEHDTFLPASNLHPHREAENYHRIFKHQLDAFLVPVIKLRRDGMKGHNIDPIGILNYAKAFVYACRNNSIISDEIEKRQLNYISLLEADINHSTRHNKTLLSSIASQRNVFFIITTILAFIVAFLKIADSVIKYSNIESNTFEKWPWYVTTVTVMGIGILGWIILIISTYSIKKREFHKDKLKRLNDKIITFFFYKDSDLPNGKLSLNLRCYIWLQDWWADITKRIFTKQKKDADSGNSRLGHKYLFLILKFLFWGVVCYAFITQMCNWISSLLL